jgi:hypothetical protein
MQFIRANTETDFFIGPVLDADGLPVTSATSADFRYVLNGSASAIPSGITITHAINGHYAAEFAAPIIDAPKMFALIVGNASLAMPPAEFTVMTESAWDSLFSATAGDSIDFILAKVALISSGSVTATLPVTSTGQIRSPILIGDDYLAANGRAFQWVISERLGFVVGTMSCKFGGSNAKTGDSWEVAGSVTDNLDGTWTLSFDLPDTQTGELAEGLYRWSVEIISADGANVTEVFSGKGVEVRAKQTTNA